jgi:mRNA interferase MazF
VTGPRRGDVWWATLPSPRGSEPGFRRPVLIVQSNQFNESRIQTIVVAAMTSNLSLAEAPGNVRAKPSDTGLRQVSVINVSQLLTIGRPFLTAKAGAIPIGVMNQVAEGLRLVLAL